MDNSIKLTPDEIRTAVLLVSHYHTAKAKMELAQQLEIEYMAQLRAKYALGEEWVCRDLLDGFMQRGEIVA